MVHLLRTAIVAVLFMIPAVSTLAQDKVLLTYKAQKGQVMRYKEEGTLVMEAAGQKLTLELKSSKKVTIEDVSASGDITFKSETEEIEVTANGQKMPAPDDAKDKSTIVLRPNGTLVSYSSDKDNKEQNRMAVRLLVAQTPIFSEKPVGVGDKWSHEYRDNEDLGIRAARADYEVLAMEKANGVDAVKIKMVFKETGSNPPLTVTSTIWVEKTSGDAVAAEQEIENLTFGGAEGPPLSGKSRMDRVEGSPLPGGTTTPDEKKPEPKKEKTIDDIVKEFEKIPGLFTLYKKKESGRDKIYMEITEDQLDRLVMMEVTASTGTASQVVAGDPISDILFRFSRMGDDRLVMVVPNINFRAPDGKPIARALKRSFPEGYLEAFKIEAKQPERKSLLIDVSNLFIGDIAQVSQLFAQGGNPLSAALGGGQVTYTLDRDKTYVETIKNFPDNLVVTSAYHFQRSGSGGGGISVLLSGTASTLADPRSAPFKLVYNLFLLPVNNGYRPRLADPRVGYFLTEFQDWSDDGRQDMMTRYIYRWHLEKEDPKAPLSRPKKPIVWYLDNAIPEEYRAAVQDGILVWNKAFERIGFKDAIEVRQMPDNADWDHADMRYNTIRWVVSPDSGYAVALFRVNPLTGQILNANITVDANLVRAFKLERKKLVEPAAFFEQEIARENGEAHAHGYHSDPRRCRMAEDAMREAWFGAFALRFFAPIGAQISEKDYISQFLRYVIAHEFGHCLGLRHNFIASTLNSLEELGDPKRVERYGTSASVMDYVAFNISALKKRSVAFFNQTIGPYDFWAVQYGYLPIDAKTPEGERYRLSQIASRSNEPGLAYQSDEQADSFDPCVARWDVGKDPMAFWTRQLQITRHLILNLGTRVPKKGESYWEFTRDFNQLLNLYARAAAVASRYVGGLYMNRNFRGDPGEKDPLVPIPAEQQLAALKLLNTYVFSENAFNFPKEYYTKFTDDPNGMNISAILTGANSFPIRDTMANIQSAALRRIYNPSVLSRIVNNEFKVTDPGKVLTLPVLFNSTRAAIWSELGTGSRIPELRRQLQRAHLDQLISMVVNPSGPAPEDARVLAWDQLRRLQRAIQAARKRAADEYTRVHLEESAMRIARALDARQMIGAPAPQRTTSLLDLLLGGARK
ncbi:MAG: zinc-dependent metalloprotease [Chloroherpetonaceae bacterium]|nr:zinc-dependent metalloprotease [Chthonomonadaceae bacterium]MDW8208192.1 zinc-dependent metalloprotease [Chloroherpetonaceae bacterium]